MARGPDLSKDDDFLSRRVRASWARELHWKSSYLKWIKYVLLLKRVMFNWSYATLWVINP